MAANRIIITPNEFSPSRTTPPKLRLAFNFEGVPGADKLVDCRARLVIYDRDLYFATALGRQEGPDPFTKDGQKVTPNLGAGPDPADPPLGAGTGVLAKVEGVIRKTLDKKWWCFKPTNAATNTGDIALSLILESRDDFANFSPLCTVSYPKDDLAGALVRYLVFRLVNLGSSFGGPGSGDVLACNVNPTHNAGAVAPVLAAANPDMSAGAVTFHVSSADESRESKIGGDGGKKEIAAAKAGARGLDPDLTGLYEAYPYDENGKETKSFDYDPPLMVHINQAGNALVGWFSPPNDNNGAKKSTPPAVLPTAAGCFFSTAKPGPNGRLCEWFVQAGGKPARNETDPDSKPTSLKIMNLKIEDGPADDVAIGITMTFEDRLTSGGALQSATLRLRRTGTSTRIPFYCLQPYLTDIDHQPDLAKVEFAREVVQDQIEVLPMTWWDRLSRRVSTELLPKIQQWSDTGGFGGGKPSDKATARDAVSQVLISLVPNPTHSNEAAARYRVICARVRALFQATDVQISNGVTHSALEWLQLMVDDQITEVVKRKRDQTPNITPTDVWGSPTDKTNIEEGFKTFQITPSGEFVYTMKFFTVGGALPTVLCVGGYGFLLRIAKEKIGKDAGGTETRTPDTSEGWAGAEHVEFAGAIAQAGAGAGFDFKKLKGKAKNLSDVPGDIEFRTCVDIGSVNDFDGASFSVNALKIGAGSWIIGKGAFVNSAFVQFSLSNGVVLDTVVDASMQVKAAFNWDKIKDAIEKKQPRTVKDFKDAAEDIAIPEATLIQYVWSGGKLLLKSKDLGKAPPIAAAAVTARQVARQSRVMLFDEDSATLSDVNRGWVEAQLATDRALFEAPGGSGTSEGYASPEATVDHNQKLTEMRAEAIVLAVKDAFGDVSVIPIKPTGYGEEPATDSKRGALLNPPDPPKTAFSLSKDDQDRLHFEERRYWPGWRRVDLTVNGLLVLRVMGRGAKS